MNYSVKLPALISSIRRQALHLGLSRKSLHPYYFLDGLPILSIPHPLAPTPPSFKNSREVKFMSPVVFMVSLKPETLSLEIVPFSVISKQMEGEVCQMKIEEHFKHFQEAGLRTETSWILNFNLQCIYSQKYLTEVMYIHMCVPYFSVQIHYSSLLWSLER